MFLTFNKIEIKKMKFAFFILLILLSCTNNNPLKFEKKIFFYYNTTTKDFYEYSSDSFNINKINHHNDRDTLISQIPFKWNEVSHYINIFSNYKYAPMDGEILNFELDTLGIIFSKSLNWNSYSSLKSNNDSINQLINKAFEYINPLCI